MDTSFVKWSDCQQWIKTDQQPQNYKFTLWISCYFDSIEYLHNVTKTVDWAMSFAQPLVIFYDERLTVNVLNLFQQLLRAQCCDIENIILLTSHGVGLSDWWVEKNSVYQEKTFKIKEWIFSRCVCWQTVCFQNLKLNSDLFNNKNIKYFFNHYAGGNTKLDRLYISLKLRELENIGIVDCLAKFSVSKEQLISHAMYLGYFKNSNEEEKISELYEKYVFNNQLTLDPVVLDVPERKRHILFDYQMSQFYIDSMCLATVINETDNTQPWTMVTEKTLRCFWHHNIAIPNGYNCVKHLEQKGFWFPHDLIDYSYQAEPDWLTRINLMIGSIKTAYHNLDGKYNEYYMDNFKNFKKNAQLVYDYYYTDIE